MLPYPGQTDSAGCVYVSAPISTDAASSAVNGVWIGPYEEIEKQEAERAKRRDLKAD